jgi:AcrR family transcriptional regulator
MAADARIIAAWDRAAGPLSRYFDLIEALGTGGDERQIVRGFRSLDKDLSAVGIRSGNPALYRPSRPISLALGTAMIDDLAARIAVASGRLGEAVQEIRRRFEELNTRSTRFAKVGNRN